MKKLREREMRMNDYLYQGVTRVNFEDCAETSWKKKGKRVNGSDWLRVPTSRALIFFASLMRLRLSSCMAIRVERMGASLGRGTEVAPFSNLSILPLTWLGRDHLVWVLFVLPKGFLLKGHLLRLVKNDPTVNPPHSVNRAILNLKVHRVLRCSHLGPMLSHFMSRDCA